MQRKSSQEQYPDKQFLKQKDLVDKLAIKVFGLDADDKTLVDEIESSTRGMSKTERRMKRIEIMKAHSSGHMAKVRNTAIYAKYMAERKKLLSMQVVEQKRKERLAARAKELKNLARRLKRAKDSGLRVEYKKCAYCGNEFGYVAEQRTKTGVVPIPKKNIPEFCSKSCLTRHSWETKRKKRYDDWKAQKQQRIASKQTEGEVNTKTHWRGSGNFYTSHACRTVNSISPFKEIDRFLE